ncbi:MAG TPA: signal peptidase I, partial [Woeseiaceae bacterium]
MNIDLALLLTVLTLVSGFFVALNRFYLQRGDRQGGAKTGAVLSTVIDYSRSFFPVLLIVLVIRSFIFEPFRIPSGSMMPTLLEGDFIFVKKYSYGLKLPVSNTKVVETGLPGRGDVVVFRLPQDTSVN